MKKILVIPPVTEAHKAILEDSVRGCGYEFAYAAGGEPAEADVREASVIIGCLDTARTKDAENCVWYQLTSAGSDAYTAPGVIPKDALLTSSVGAYGLTVSEHMLAQTFAVIRRFGQYGRNQVRHEWRHMGAIASVEGSTIAVLGLGDIGGGYARKVKALGAYVIGLRKSVKEKPGYVDEQYSIDALDEVLPRADIVAMVLPGGPGTEHIMDEARLRRMKRGAYIINAGRGSAIDLNALRTLLDEGHIAGAALDVTEPEPLPADHPLWDYDNVIITPHAAGFFFLPETLTRVVRIAAENLRRYTAGEPLRNVVEH